METRMISLALIDMPAWNSRMAKSGAALRKEEETIAELAESMAAEGQESPVEVEPKEGGRFELVFGTRRYRAATLNKWPEIAAVVREPSNPLVRMRRNIVENLQRVNLTPFEEARAYAEMRKTDKNAQIAAQCGRSVSHISNLAGAYERLPEPILVAWAANHPVATFDNVTALANPKNYKTSDDQVKAWDELVRQEAARAAQGEKTGKRGKAKGKGGSASYSVVKANVDAAIDFLSPKKTAHEAIGGTKKWANDLVQWLIGQRKNPPEGIVIPVKGDKN